MIDTAWLRALGENRLAALLDRRPESVRAPAPACLAELAGRLDHPRSVLAALRRLDRPTLQVTEALAALGGEADRAALDRLLGVPARAGTDDVDRALAILRDHALLTDGNQLSLVEAARRAWPHPLDLGVPVIETIRYATALQLRDYVRNLGLKPATRKADLLLQAIGAWRDADLIRQVVAGAPAATRELLRKIALTGEPLRDLDIHVSYGPGRLNRPWQWAIERGLLTRTAAADGGLVVPAEIALALRGPDWTAPFEPVAPRPVTRPVPTSAVARDSAAAGAATLRLISDLLDEAGQTPVALLKAGGIGTRELRRLVKRIGGTEPEVRLALALAHHAGLLALSVDGGTPTESYDEWLRGEPAERLATLLGAWWSLPYVPTAESEVAWTPGDRGDGSAALRAAVLTEMALLPTDGGSVAVTAPDSLTELVLWRRPYAFNGPEPERHAMACWREAALLGAVGAGSLSTAGRALLTDDDLAASLTELGSTERRVRIQADLTALVAGTPAMELADLLDSAADRESRGTASTWRFTPASVRRALDAGRTGAVLLAELTAVAIDGLPQPLTYLINDTARRHGAVRGQQVACCLRADDPALLAEIAADRRLRALGLRTLAPTVLAGAQPLAETLAALRSAGYAPVAEGPDGVPLVERARPQRVRVAKPIGARQGTTRSAVTGPAAARAAAPGVTSDPVGLARVLLDRPDASAPPSSPLLAVIRRSAPELPESQARLLANAINAGLPVWIDYLNRAGNSSSRVIENIELTDGALLARCRLRDDERMFNLGRVLSVSPA